MLFNLVDRAEDEYELLENVMSTMPTYNLSLIRVKYCVKNKKIYHYQQMLN